MDVNTPPIQQIYLTIHLDEGFILCFLIAFMFIICFPKIFFFFFFFCLLKKEAVLYASQYDLGVTTNLSLEEELTAAVLSSF